MTTTEPDAFTLAFAAGRRYWFDATFAEQVKRAVKVAEAGQPDDGFDRFDRHSLTMGAAVALHLASIARPMADAAAADAADRAALDAYEAGRQAARTPVPRPLGDHGSQRDRT